MTLEEFSQQPLVVLLQKATQVYDIKLLQIGSIVLLKRFCKDKKTRIYLAQIVQIKKPSAYVIDFRLEAQWDDEQQMNVTRTQKNKINSMLFSKDVAIFVLQQQSQTDERRRKAEERRAYAQNRNALLNARTQDQVYYDTLGLQPNCTLEEFKQVRKKAFIKWHPDKQLASGMNKQEFDKISSQIVQAISYIELKFKS